MTQVIITLFLVAFVGIIMYESGKEDGRYEVYKEINKVADNSVRVHWITLSNKNKED